jgi:hypothetical protein
VESIQDDGCVGILAHRSQKDGVSKFLDPADFVVTYGELLVPGRRGRCLAQRLCEIAFNVQTSGCWQCIATA